MAIKEMYYYYLLVHIALSFLIKNNLIAQTIRREKFDFFFYVNLEKNKSLKLDCRKLDKLPILKLKEYNILGLNNISKQEVNESDSILSFLFDRIHGDYIKRLTYDSSNLLHYAGKDTLNLYLEKKKGYMKEHLFYFILRISFVDKVVSYLFVEESNKEICNKDDKTWYLINVKENFIASIVAISSITINQFGDTLLYKSKRLGYNNFYVSDYLLPFKRHNGYEQLRRFYSKFMINKKGEVEIAPPLVPYLIIE